MAQSISLIQNNFISGEISPLLEGRIDSPRYQTGLRTCQNAIPIRQGGLVKRQGTHFIGNTYENKAARLVEYVNLSGTKYILEFTDLKMRIWKDDYTLIASVVTTPWGASILSELSFAVMKGLVYVAHPTLAIRTIDSTWTLATPTFTGDRTFAATNKYARSIFFFQGRLGVAGTNDEPNSVFLSRSPAANTGTDRFTDFTMGTAADNAIYLQEADLLGTHIHWVIGQRRLLMGTDRSIWMDSGQLATPATFDMNLIAYNGSAEIAPVLLDSIVIYAGKGGSSLHALSYSEEGGGFQDFDLSADAEHMLSSPIAEIKTMAYPHPIAWIVRDDGMLVSCTLDFKNGVVAWATHPMEESSVVENLALFSTDTEDAIWMVVKRGSIRTVEQMHFHDIGTLAQADFHYVDAGVTTVSATPISTVSGLTHLEGMTVSAWADGAILPDKVVASGAVTYSEAFLKIHVGLPIKTKIETLRPEIPVQGTSQGKMKGIKDIKLRMYRSFGGSVSARLGTAVKLLYWIAGTYVWGSALSLYTDTKGTELAAPLDADATVVIVHNEPTPFNLLALIYRVAIVEY